MRCSFEVAQDIAEKVALFRVVKADPSVPYHKVERWSIDRDLLKAEVNHILTPAQMTCMTWDLFNEILGEVHVELRSRLYGDGFNS